jgi:hypothetical protein
MTVITTQRQRVITVDETDYPIVIDVVVKENNNSPERRKYILIQNKSGKLILDLYVGENK